MVSTAGVRSGPRRRFSEILFPRNDARGHVPADHLIRTFVLTERQGGMGRFSTDPGTPDFPTHRMINNDIPIYLEAALAQVISGSGRMLMNNQPARSWGPWRGARRSRSCLREGGNRPRRKASAAGRLYDLGPPSASTTFSGVMGRLRIRAPKAWATALATAAAVGTRAGSPSPFAP